MKKTLYGKHYKSAVSGLVVIILLAAVCAIYFDGMPSKPKCAANEIAVMSDGAWYCLQAHKP